MKSFLSLIILGDGIMSNNSNNKSRWKEVDPDIREGSLVLKIDGSKFKAFRVPNLDLCSLPTYYEVIKKVAKKVLARYRCFRFCYVIDDEFHFFLYTKDIKEKDRRFSKSVVMPTSFLTSQINRELLKVELTSKFKMDIGNLTYDARLVRLNEIDVEDYFVDIINHGKLFLGNYLTGQGMSFMKLNEKKIKEILRSMSIKNDDRFNFFFGSLIFRNGKILEVYNLNIDEFTIKAKELISSSKRRTS